MKLHDILLSSPGLCASPYRTDAPSAPRWLHDWPKLFEVPPPSAPPRPRPRRLRALRAGVLRRA